ncbi:MAG: rRNA maturation RNase YbeY [Clostridiales bacterium]|nr:rRNA maturation RNase YbeY [Clostridiales bacterium]
MSFIMEELVEADFNFDYRALAGRTVDFCMEHEGFPYEAEVSLTLTDDAGICEINSQMRGIDASTDVLSFPMLSYEVPGDFTFLEEESEDDFNPDTGEALLGDIVISVEHVKAQAESYGHSTMREFSFLIVHSMLHLFGYDHIEEADAAVMEEKQRVIMEGLGISR